MAAKETSQTTARRGAMACRIVVFALGVMISAIGVNLITLSGLGTPPPSTISLALSTILGQSFALWTFLFNVVLVVLQVVLLRRNFPPKYLLQVPISIVFSWVIETSNGPISMLVSDSYPIEIAMLLVGCLVLATGIWFELVGSVMLLPGEGFVDALAKVFHQDFGKMKIASDVAMTIVAVVIGLVACGQVVGIREGTLIAALLVGMLSRFLKRTFPGFERAVTGERTRGAVAMPEASSAVPEPTADGHVPMVITVSREYGSHGYEIAKSLADQLGYSFCDKNVVDAKVMTASQALDEYLARSEDASMGLAQDFVAQFYNFSESSSPAERVYIAQSKEILDAGRKGDCVIVGRCADHVCRNLPNVYRVFICADEDQEAENVAKAEHLDVAYARKRVRDTNARRASRCHYFTGHTWGQADYYDLCINVSRIGSDGAMALIRQGVEQRQSVLSAQ
jgi:uncharacterized membrane protein YczE/cytidylate kinase